MTSQAQITLFVFQTLVDAQKSALKKLTTCLREAESQKAELTKDLEDQKRKLEQEVSKNEAALNSSKLDQNPSSANQVKMNSLYSILTISKICNYMLA